jgi:hypothetical protein
MAANIGRAVERDAPDMTRWCGHSTRVRATTDDRRQKIVRRLYVCA